MLHLFSNYRDNKKAKKLNEFEDLAYPLMDQLYRTACGMAKNDLDAEDLVQETYLKAWRYFDKFEPGTNFRAWIFRILTNTLINQFRKKTREPLRKNFETVTETFVHEEIHEVDRFSQSGFAENYEELFDDSITLALDQIPERYRIVVLLADVCELRYKEIATVIGSPIGTVMSRLFRGRKMLAQSLGPYATANGHIAHQTPAETTF